MKVFLSSKARTALANAYNIYRQIQESHPGLERYYILTLLNSIAERTSILVGEQGSGKTAMGVSVSQLLKDLGVYSVVFAPDKFSLHVFAEPKVRNQINNQSVVIFIDDYSATGTDYSRTILLSSISTLVYKRSFQSAMYRFAFTVSVSKACAILNIQPSWLNYLFNTNEFLGMIHDKSFRIYILHRPVRPNDKLPYPEGIKTYFNSLEQIKIDEEGIRKIPIYRYLRDNIRSQNSITRAWEAVKKLLKASALLNNRESVNFYDMWLLFDLTKILRIENMIKTEVETSGVTKYSINTKLLRLITMYVTFKRFTVERMSKEFSIGLNNAYQILEANKQILTHNGNEYTLLPEYAKEVNKLL